jgi:periplasmic protein CpxP/Spy
MYKKILWIVAFTFSLILSQSTFAHSKECGEGMKTLMGSLKLDDSQKGKIKPILEQLKSSIKDSETQFKDLHTQINQQIASDNMDQDTLDGLVDKKAKLIGDMMKAKATAQHQIFTILNAQQKTQYHDNVKKLDAKMTAKYANCHNQE